MMAQTGRLLLFLAALLLPPPLRAGNSFDWDPLTVADWRVVEDSTNGIRHAVILFEKIIADDRRMDEQKCYLTIYWRLKIFDARGRHWGDVKAPLIHPEQKIEAIRGRTVLPDGREFTLAQSHIFEKKLVSAGGRKIKQKSFSLPGVADGCIIEYSIKYRIPLPNSLWLAQKEIVLLRGEYHWRFYRRPKKPKHAKELLTPSLSGITAPPSSLSAGIQKPLPDDVAEASHENFADKAAVYPDTPNYIWLHDNRPISVEPRPSGEDPEELFFTIRNVPAFAKEPHSLPEIKWRDQLRCYYGKPISVETFWSAMARELTERLESYGAKIKRAQKVIAQFSRLGSDEAKIEAAYQWCQNQIKNLSYLPGNDKIKSNDTVDETLERGYGTQSDINYGFYHLLRAMNIDARIAFVADREKDLFIPSAQYWQFDRTLVAVPAGNGGYRFYSPGDMCLPSTHVPWVNEKERAFVIGDTIAQFVDVPISTAGQNRTNRAFKLQLRDDLNLAGVMFELSWGHAAQKFRLLAAQTERNQRQQRLQKALADLLPNAQLDSIVVRDPEAMDKPVTLSSKVKLSGNVKLSGDRLLLQPFKLLRQTVNPFQADARANAVVFDYAYELVEALNIDLPVNWEIEALPTDTMFVNNVGASEAIFIKFGRTLSVQRRFKLNHPYCPPADYSHLRALFQAHQTLSASTVVLRTSRKVAVNDLRAE
jgi:hypothetical protein